MIQAIAEVRMTATTRPAERLGQHPAAPPDHQIEGRGDRQRQHAQQADEVGGHHDDPGDPVGGLGQVTLEAGGGRRREVGNRQDDRRGGECGQQPQQIDGSAQPARDDVGFDDHGLQVRTARGRWGQERLTGQRGGFGGSGFVVVAGPERRRRELAGGVLGGRGRKQRTAEPDGRMLSGTVELGRGVRGVGLRRPRLTTGHPCIVSDTGLGALCGGEPGRSCPCRTPVVC